METLDTYLTELAGPSATPGGGSAAMFVAATGVALLGMVCRISAANPKFTQKHQAALAIATEADTLRAGFVAARKLDEAAFERVVEAQRLPKESEEQRGSRASALEAALDHAAAIPLQMAAQAIHGLHLAGATLALENKNLISDVGCAAEFLHAAMKACAYNVRINHHFMKNRVRIEEQAQELSRIEGEGEVLLERIRAALGVH